MYVKNNCRVTGCNCSQPRCSNENHRWYLNLFLYRSNWNLDVFIDSRCSNYGRCHQYVLHKWRQLQCRLVLFSQLKLGWVIKLL